MPMFCTSLPVELEQLILAFLYPRWCLLTEEKPSRNGIRRLTINPSTHYETAPLLTNRSWRERSIEALRHHFQGMLDMTTTSRLLHRNTNQGSSFQDDAAKQTMAFEITDNFKHLYHRITTLRFDNSSVLLATLPILRPAFPRLGSVELVHEMDYRVTGLDLSVPRNGHDLTDLIYTTLWDPWLTTWMELTWNNFYSHLLSRETSGLKVYFTKSFTIERMGNQRLIVAFDVTSYPFRITRKQKIL